MNSDGTNVVQLTNLKGFAGVPVYSPDEKLIVFQWRETNNFQDNSKWRICLINIDGSGFRVITPGLANDRCQTGLATASAYSFTPTAQARTRSTQ